MITQQTYQGFQVDKKFILIIAICTVLLIFANILLDFAFTLFQNSAFYISESLLFSSYWLLFFPLLTLVLKSKKKLQKLESKLCIVILTIVLHLFSYPALVWIISKIFYTHTFNYWQTFNFGLSAYFIKTVLIYGFSFLAFTILNKKVQTSQIEDEEKTEKQNFISSILVADHNNKKLLLQVDDILYFSARSPYISIYHTSKKYLHTGTLKSLGCQLDKNQFVRIHKSHIVNINKISSLQSRHNGDYDITLSDNTVLRVSRNYAKDFKLIFSEQHQLTLK